MSRWSPQRQQDDLFEIEGVSTDQFVEGAGGASPQLDEEQVQPMDVSLDQSATATKRRAETK